MVFRFASTVTLALRPLQGVLTWGCSRAAASNGAIMPAVWTAACGLLIVVVGVEGAKMESARASTASVSLIGP